MPTVYLAGGIAGLSFSEAVQWRCEVRDALLPRIECLSPLRGITEDAVAQYNATGRCDGIYPFTEQAVFRRDFEDVCASDLVFANLLGAKRVSQGTIYELAWAYAFRKRIVVVIEPAGNPHEHVFLRGLQTYRVPDLGTAIEVTRSNLLPE